MLQWHELLPGKYGGGGAALLHHPKLRVVAKTTNRWAVCPPHTQYAPPPKHNCTALTNAQAGRPPKFTPRRNALTGWGVGRVHRGVLGQSATD